MYLTLPTIAPLPGSPESRFHDVARRLAAGEELDTESLIVILAASGKSMADLRQLCERFARRAVPSGLPTF